MKTPDTEWDEDKVEEFILLIEDLWNNPKDYDSQSMQNNIDWFRNVLTSRDTYWKGVTQFERQALENMRSMRIKRVLDEHITKPVNFIQSQQEEARSKLADVYFNRSDKSIDDTVDSLISQVVQNTVEEIRRRVEESLTKELLPLEQIIAQPITTRGKRIKQARHVGENYGIKRAIIQVKTIANEMTLNK